MKNSAELEAKMQEISRLVHGHTQYFLGAMMTLLIITDTLVIALIDRFAGQGLLFYIVAIVAIVNMHSQVESSLRQLAAQLEQRIFPYSLSMAAVLAWMLMDLELASPTLRVPLLSNCIDCAIILWLTSAAMILMTTYCCNRYPNT